MRDGSEKSRVDCAKEILNRAYGRPPQSVSVDVGDMAQRELDAALPGAMAEIAAELGLELVPAEKH